MFQCYSLKSSHLCLLPHSPEVCSSHHGPNFGVLASISPSNEYSGLISYRIDWLDLLAAQGTRKSLLQNHRSHWSFITRAIIADGNGWSFVASFIFTWENNTDPYQASIHFSTSCADQYILWHVLKHFWTPNISMAITIYNRKSPNTQEHCFTFHGSNRVR